MTTDLEATYVHLARRVEAWDAAGLARSTVDFTTAQNPTSTIDGTSRLLFSSSNYLGLSTHPEVIRAAVTAAHTYGMGSGGSRLTTGTTVLHSQVERSIANWLRYPECVFFSTGFQANLAAVASLATEGAVIFSDANNHASLIDGTRLAKSAGARTIIYPNRDVKALDDALSGEADAEMKLVITDGVFSMDGTIANVADLVAVAHRHGALVLVDDAHGIGTCGSTGRGCTEELQGTELAPDILVGTASKALGAEGGFICTNPTIAHLLRNQGRSFVFSTSLSAPQMAAVGAAVGVLNDEGEWRTGQLRARVRQLRAGLAELGWEVPEDETPIVPVLIGDEVEAMRVAAELREAGFHVPAIRYPTVRRGAAILRVTVMATHTAEDVERLLEALRKIRRSGS